MPQTIDRETLISHVDGVRRLARSLVRDAGEADDIVQDTMVAALESTTGRRAGPKAWLAGVTRNMARRTARSAGRRKRHERAAAGDGTLPSAAELVIRAAEQSRLLDQVVALEEPYRSAILMRFVEDLPPREIAAELGRPVETIRTQVKRGLQRLRERLDEANGGERSRWHAALAPLVIAPEIGAPAVAAGVLWGVGALCTLAVAVVLFFAWDSEPKEARTSTDLVASDRAGADRAAAGTQPAGRAATDVNPQVVPVGAVEAEPARSAVAAAPPPSGVKPEPDRAPPAPAAATVVAPAGRTSALRYADNGYANLDPAHASLYRVNDERLILALFEGLTVLDPKTGRAIPGAAESWTSSPDGKTWTFKLRSGAKWSDGSPVKASDFVFAWSRAIDPFTESEWTWLFRSIKGCGVITDNAARIDAFTTLRSGLKNLKLSNPNGTPGEDLNLLLDDTGVRPFLVGVKSRSVKRMLRWKAGDLFPPEMVDKAIDALKTEKRALKSAWQTDFDAFGKSGSGIHAPGDHTVVITTDGDVPFLPELLARSAFVPLHKSVAAHRAKAFESGSLVSNGPFRLAGRGSKPPDLQQMRRVLSVVDLARNPHYAGSNPAKVDRLECITDQGIKEDVIGFEQGALHWVNTTWPEFPAKKLRAQVEALKGYGVRASPVVLYLRFRCDRVPFKDKNARKAFALALDREKLAKWFWPGGTPAFRLVPPGIEGRAEGISCPKPDLGAARDAYTAVGGIDWVELSFGESPGQDDAGDQLIKGWKKVLGIESSKRIETENDIRNILRSGTYYAMLSTYRGFVNDPYAYLAPLHSADADSGLGWRDTAFDTLLDAARDPQTALDDPEGFLGKTGMAQLKGALDAAKAGRAGRVRLRQEALAAAERRLLDEYVVVPLLFLKEATLIGDVKGMGSDEARRNPGYVGSLWNLSK